MKKPTCETCVYWSAQIEDKKDGVCRKHAPRAITSFGVADWALTMDGEFCGEHHLFDVYLEYLQDGKTPWAIIAEIEAAELQGGDIELGHHNG